MAFDNKKFILCFLAVNPSLTTSAILLQLLCFIDQNFERLNKNRLNSGLNKGG